MTEGHIGWADIIFVMEKKHLRRIRDKFGDLLYEKKIINLDIADDYQFMDEVLIEILQNRVSEIIQVNGQEA
ncbi:protein tyrosine phosphatase [Gottfriedia acidiceleris]|uniref:protein tyrosine phosphatase n=1 Tax=Gottfriedia acidiceleris TaxID=371036 RepID=UPI002E255826